MRRRLFLAVIAATACDAGTTGPDTCVSAALTIGAPTAGSFASSDCRPDGDEVGDVYTFTLASESTLRINMTGVNGTTSLFASPASDNTTVFSFREGTNYAVVAPGTYELWVNGESGKSTGNYTLNVTNTSLPGGCSFPSAFVYVRGPATISGAFTANDCAASQGSRADNFEVWMNAGRNYSISTTSTVGIALETRAANSSTTLRGQFFPAGPGGYTVTATTTGYHVVGVINSVATSVTGNYTLTVRPGS